MIKHIDDFLGRQKLSNPKALLLSVIQFAAVAGIAAFILAMTPWCGKWILTILFVSGAVAFMALFLWDSYCFLAISMNYVGCMIIAWKYPSVSGFLYGGALIIVSLICIVRFAVER